MTRTPVYIICSPRAQVGKTLVARLLAEFLTLQRGDVQAFDINQKEPSLLDFLPRVTETADVSSTFGQMALMDRLIVNDGIAKVIDLGFHVFDEFFNICSQIGFIKEATRRGIVPVVLFVADNDWTTGRAHAMLRDQVPDYALVTVENRFIMRDELPMALSRGRVLRMAALPAFLKSIIDRLNFSFTNYLRTERDTSTELHQWVRDNYYNLREIELALGSERRVAE